jgi:hypothetical protein
MTLLALLLGCPKPPAAPPLETPRVPADEVRRTPVAGPRYWTEGGGLCLEVPVGWTGTTGPAPLLLELEQEGTGFRIEVLAWDGRDAPADREGYVVMFDDAGAYRTVPILTPSGSRTSEALDPGGDSVHAWYAPLNGRLVEVAAVLPAGRATEGLAAVEPVLRALCTTQMSRQ